MQEEYFTTVRAEVYLTIRSDKPLDKKGVYEFLSETSYDFGDDYGLTVEGGGTCHIAGTRWEDNEIVNLNKEDF